MADLPASRLLTPTAPGSQEVTAGISVPTARIGVRGEKPTLAEGGLGRASLLRETLPRAAPWAVPELPGEAVRDLSGENEAGWGTELRERGPQRCHCDVTSDQVSLPELEAKKPDTGAATESEVQQV